MFFFTWNKNIKNILGNLIKFSKPPYAEHFEEEDFCRFSLKNLSCRRFSLKNLCQSDWSLSTEWRLEVDCENVVNKCWIFEVFEASWTFH